MEESAEELLDVPVEILSKIMATNPISSVKFIKIANAIYAHWKEWMGRIRDQGMCETCWAVVSAELVSALLFIKGINKNYIEYSTQDLLDFSDPEKAKKCDNDDHYCYFSSVRRGLLYVLREGLQKEIDRPYKGCRVGDEGYLKISMEAMMVQVAKFGFFAQPY